MLMLLKIPDGDAFNALVRVGGLCAELLMHNSHPHLRHAHSLFFKRRPSLFLVYRLQLKTLELGCSTHVLPPKKLVFEAQRRFACVPLVQPLRAIHFAERRN